jgi:hypothetical protein
MDRVSWWQKGFWRMNQQSAQNSPQIAGEIQDFRRFAVSGGKTKSGAVGFLSPSRRLVVFVVLAYSAKFE